ncbi:hypothetical protein Bca52824_083746 [Brassica carinata]|uniref:Uncharacterized protein n=1 Tax=Brassica carinata TaxID=52824 RepID=A0A8X7PLC2_BRACI|nr:hypothetical protein Bca52824_083746 [Brassica carinata]
MAYNKKHVKIGLWPEKEEKEKKYSKNREALKLTVPTFLLFCSICLIFLILLSPFTSPPQTSFTASSLRARATKTSPSTSTIFPKSLTPTSSKTADT